MDVVLDDAKVSRQSALIIERGGQHFLQDLGGRNLIRIDEKHVVSRRLMHGDVILIGDCRLAYRQAEPGQVTPMEESKEGEILLDPRGAIEEWEQGGSPGKQPTGKILEILHSYAELIRRLPDRESLFQSALEPIFNLLDIKRSFIGLFDKDNPIEIVAELNADKSRSDGFSRSIVERVRREEVAILFGDEAETPSRSDTRSQVKYRIRSAMCVPIFGQEEVRGVLYLDNREARKKEGAKIVGFTREDLQFATILGHLISMAFDKEELYRRINEENLSLKSMLRKKHRLVGTSDLVKEMRRKISRVAAFDTTVLILGESGTGKELVARAIHDRSQRASGPFVAVNCAAIPETLLESELFGYAPHSGISGANPQGKAGKFELADKGTLFLDEIGDMSIQTQAKILRILEERVVDRLGGQEVTPVDIRVVAATHQNLEAKVSDGTFREDLFYRLKVLRIDVPALKDRSEDILSIANYFLESLVADTGKEVKISPKACECLLAYSWPGNVRELRNVMEEALLMGNGRTIYPEDLPSELSQPENQRHFGRLADIERSHLQRVLDGVNWNKRRASEILGINRSTLYDKIKLYSLEKPEAPAVSGSQESL